MEVERRWRERGGGGEKEERWREKYTVVHARGKNKMKLRQLQREKFNQAPRYFYTQSCLILVS